jgi:hypothetical protein
MPHGNPRAGDRASADPLPPLSLGTQRNTPRTTRAVFCSRYRPCFASFLHLRAFSRVVCHATVDMPNFLGPARLSSYTRSPSSLSSCQGPPGLAVSLKRRGWNSFHYRYRLALGGAEWGSSGMILFPDTPRVTPFPRSESLRPLDAWERRDDSLRCPHLLALSRSTASRSWTGGSPGVISCIPSLVSASYSLYNNSSPIIHPRVDVDNTTARAASR